jgi:hypothetical protein
MNEIIVEPTEWLMIKGKGRDKEDIIILENVNGTFKIYRKTMPEVKWKDGIEVIRVV